MSLSREEIAFKQLSEYKKPIAKNKDKVCSKCLYCIKMMESIHHRSNLDMFSKRKTGFPVLVDNVDFPVKPDFGCKFFKSKK